MSIVKSSLNEAASSAPAAAPQRNAQQNHEAEELLYPEDNEWQEGEYDANDIVFDDTGEGAGIEGDLEDDDD